VKNKSLRWKRKLGDGVAKRDKKLGGNQRRAWVGELLSRMTAKKAHNSGIVKRGTKGTKNKKTKVAETKSAEGEIEGSNVWSCQRREETCLRYSLGKHQRRRQTGVKVHRQILQTKIQGRKREGRNEKSAKDRLEARTGKRGARTWSNPRPNTPQLKKVKERKRVVSLGKGFRTETKTKDESMGSHLKKN